LTRLARPGGNVTGFTLIEFEIIGKWLELLREMAPRISRARLLFNPATAPFFESWLRDLGATSVIPTELNRLRCTIHPALPIADSRAES